MRKSILMLAATILSAGAVLVSCDDEEEVSKLPVFDKVTVTPTTAVPGDTLTATVTFSYSGNYVNGTYSYSTSPSLASGTFSCGSSRSSASFKIVVPEPTGSGEEEDEEVEHKTTTYRLTVRPSTMAAYAGKAPYIDPSSMGSISTTFDINY